MRARSRDDRCESLRAIAVCRAFRIRTRPSDARPLPRGLRSTTFPSGAHLGRDSKSCCLQAPRPSIGFAARTRSRRVDRLFPRVDALVGCRTGTGVAPRRRRLGPHADGHRRGAHADRRSRSSAAGVVMLGAVCHDLGKPPTTAFIDGRIRSLDARAGRRGAGHRRAGSTEHAHAGRVTTSASESSGSSRTISSLACSTRRPRRCRTAPSAGWPRKSTWSCSRVSRSRTAAARRRFRLLGDGLVSRTRARLGVEHAAPEPLVDGRHLLALGVDPRGGGSAKSSARLPEAASSIDRDARGGSTLARELLRVPDSDANTISSSMRRCCGRCVSGSGFRVSGSGVPGSGSGFRVGVRSSGLRVGVPGSGSAIRILRCG